MNNDHLDWCNLATLPVLDFTYTVTKLQLNVWECVMQSGDQKDSWRAETMEKAAKLLIKYARELNDEYISMADISVYDYDPEVDRNADANKLLSAVENGEIFVFHKSHPIVKYRITQDEADLIVGIREGRYLLQDLADPPCTEDEDNDFLKELRSLM